jgi:hypothetical protein
MSRLQQMDKSLVELVTLSTDSKRVGIKRFAIQTVLAVIPKMPETLEAIKCVTERAVPNLELSKTILEIAETHDEHSYQGKDDDTFDWFCFYSQARALRALSHALEENSVESTCDCIYESIHSFVPEEIYFQEIKTLIRS